MEILNLLLAVAGLAFVSAVVVCYLRFRRASLRRLRSPAETPSAIVPL